jgi:hypothetical protein
VILLSRPIEEAFDNGYLVILETQDVFTAHWLGADDAQIAAPKTYPWSPSSEKMDEASLTTMRE